jgi:hypothetical protein
MATKKKEPLTWAKLVRAEPRLGRLLAEVRSIERELWATREDGEICLDGYSSVRVYLDVIKPNVEHLVGWGRRGGPDFLQTSEAYALAIDTIYEALPGDFDEDEIDEARERAYEAELDEGEWLVVAGPQAA